MKKVVIVGAGMSANMLETAVAACEEVNVTDLTKEKMKSISDNENRFMIIK